jgi:hypothetical protein
MLQYTKAGLLALALASAAVYAQDRGPGSPSAPNTAAEQSTARDAAMRNCEKLSGTAKDNCIRDYQAKTGSRTEPSNPSDRSGVSGGGMGSSAPSSGAERGSASGPPPTTRTQ